MSRNKNLRKSAINQILEAISAEHLQSPLPSQSALAEMYNISRTTVRYALEYLTKIGVIAQELNQYKILREPNINDPFIDIPNRSELQDTQFEQFFNEAIKLKTIKPGDEFTEADLARKAGANVVVVREFLLRFSRFNLIDNLRHGRWVMKQFEQSYADKLFELREMFETHALVHFLNLPKEDNRWKEAQQLLLAHRELRDEVITEYQAFSELDHRFHQLILSAADNPFMDEFFDIISMIFHYHYQWDDSDLRSRNMVGIEEHMTILGKMIAGDDIGAMNELRRHLYTASADMKNSLCSIPK